MDSLEKEILNKRPGAVRAFSMAARRINKVMPNSKDLTEGIARVFNSLPSKFDIQYPIINNKEQ